jgi:hypothetical protein
MSAVVWVLIFYGVGGFFVVDNIRTQAVCEALATVVTADVKATTGYTRPHRCISVAKR